jgi:hypothetical protein
MRIVSFSSKEFYVYEEGTNEVLFFSQNFFSGSEESEKKESLQIILENPDRYIPTSKWEYLLPNVTKEMKKEIEMLNKNEFLERYGYLLI